MYKVYWTDLFGKTHSEEYTDMVQALNYTQHLRNEGNRFVVMGSEVVGNVTKMGVADVGPDYNWKKRR